MTKTNEEFDRFQSLLNRVVSVPHEEIKRREKVEHNRKVWAKNLRQGGTRRGPLTAREESR